MPGKEFTPEILRFKDATDSERNRVSEREELNSGFIRRLSQNQTKRGGGGCTRSNQYPIEGSAEIFLTGYTGESAQDSTVYTSEVTLDEGDAATIRTGTKEFRVKFFGLSIERPKFENIRKSQSAYVSFDVWNSDEQLWKEIEALQGFDRPLEWDTAGGSTVRLTINSAPGRDAEADFRWLIQEGLSPAEALDYWMVEIMNESQAQWAEERGKTPQAISKNVQSAKSRL